jgi:hypothetical protein
VVCVIEYTLDMVLYHCYCGTQVSYLAGLVPSMDNMSTFLDAKDVPKE